MSALPQPLSAPALAEKLERWFLQHGKDYPWRRTTDPYAILVSEVMLQQTQIATVLSRGYYERWLQLFPDFPTLAAAAEQDILKAWEGLGYYRRARNLQKLAQVIVSDHHGVMPQEHAAILALPGIGPYTAGAIASFAHDQAHPIVDGNVARVLSRLCDDPTPVDSKQGQQTLWARAQALVTAARSPRALNSALMELGQTVCRTGRPDCIACPLKADCLAQTPAELPVKSKRIELTDVAEHVFLHVTEGTVLLEQETGNRRTGLWKLPALPAEEKHPPLLHKARYGITRYRVDLHVHQPPAEVQPGASQHYIPLADLPSIPMPSPYRRALTAAIQAGKPFRLDSDPPISPKKRSSASKKQLLG